MIRMAPLSGVGRAKMDRRAERVFARGEIDDEVVAHRRVQAVLPNIVASVLHGAPRGRSGSDRPVVAPGGHPEFGRGGRARTRAERDDQERKNPPAAERNR